MYCSIRKQSRRPLGAPDDSENKFRGLSRLVTTATIDRYARDTR